MAVDSDPIISTPHAHHIFRKMEHLIREALKKTVFFRNNSQIRGRGFGIPKLYVKFWRPLFLAIKFTFSFLNLAKIQFFIPKSASGGVYQFGNYS